MRAIKFFTLVSAVSVFGPVIVVVGEDAAPKREKPDENVSRFTGIYLQSEIAAVGIYDVDSEGKARHKETLRVSLDNPLPEVLPAATVEDSLVCQTTTKAASMLIVKYSELKTSINLTTGKATGYRAFPIFNSFAVYFISTPPQPMIVLTVNLDKLTKAISRLPKQK